MSVREENLSIGSKKNSATVQNIVGVHQHVTNADNCDIVMSHDTLVDDFSSPKASLPPVKVITDVKNAKTLRTTHTHTLYLAILNSQ